MNLVLFGATGESGRQLVLQALERGHALTALVRNPDALQIQHDRLVTVKGDVLDPDSVAAVIAGKDAVLSALGVRVLRRNSILSDGTANILAAMKKHGVRRFICQSSLGVGDSRGQPGWVFRWLFISFLFRNIFADKEIQEQLILKSGLDWTIVRPAALTDGPRTGQYRVWTGPPPAGVTSKIRRSDVAEFMLNQLSDDAFLGKTPGISS